MEVTNPNNVKIYNLSKGKSLPEWLSERKRKRKQNKNVDFNKQFQLIQDFDMPAFSSRVKVSNDGQFILATGNYKPRVRCYDVEQQSMKFERCFDSEVVNFEILSDDYSKVVFLQCDRYIEFHAQYGRYYRMRIPKFGRDLTYHTPSCDLYVVGAGNEIYRLNLETGMFMQPYVSTSPEFNVCGINPEHHLFLCGSTQGQVEAWDPRSKERVGVLDCLLNIPGTEYKEDSLSAITSLAFADGLTMAVGTSTGEVLLYDLRSDKPVLVKDHLYGLPVTDIEFLDGVDLVVSMDSKIVRFWGSTSGKTMTSIEPGIDLNDLCMVPKTGMMYIANEGRKILTYFIPALGPAPSWCHYLENLTEEMEDKIGDVVFDDYKFVSTKELEEMGLKHLIGTNLLRAYMHGYFMNAYLYKKVKPESETFSYEKHRQERIKKKLQEERLSRIQIEKELPSVNRNLAEKLINNQRFNPRKGINLFEDERFSALFTDENYQIDENAEEFRRLNPIIKCQDRKREKANKIIAAAQFEDADSKKNDSVSSDEFGSSSEDEREMKQQYRKINKDERARRREEDREANVEPNFYALKSGEEFKFGAKVERTNAAKKSLGERVSENVADSAGNRHRVLCHRQVTFTYKKEEHPDRKGKGRGRGRGQIHKDRDRKKFVRSARGLGHKTKRF